MNRIVLVTGGGRGIGAGICDALAREGWSIASTVAEHLDVACQCGDDARVVARRRGAVATSAPDFRVVSVDRWGNEGR